MKNIKKIIIPIIMATVVFTYPIVVTIIFIKEQDKIYNEVLKSNIARLDEISQKIKNSIHLEIKHSIHMLESIVELSNIDIENLSLEENLAILKGIKNRGNFNALGIVTNKGEIIDIDGFNRKIKLAEFEKNFKALSQNGYYISDILVSSNKEAPEEILISIPLYKQEKIVGILFGYYPIVKITENIVFSEEQGQYFQIIDTNGEYINRSNNKSVLAGGGECLWNEMKRYTFFNGNSVSVIKKNVEERKSGHFYFEYGKEGRYITYEPLGINNWYIFSALTKEKLNSYAVQIQRISKELLFYLICINILSLGSVLGLVFYTYRLIKNQAERLEIKNKIFKMLIHKADDIIFEIHIKEKNFILYKSVGSENREFHFPLTYLEPENLIKNDIIKLEHIFQYKKLYDKFFSWENIENQEIQLNIDNYWRWYRVHTMVINNDSIIGIFEDFTDEKEKEIEIIKINEKSKYDFLTGIYNREAFEKEFNNFISKDKSNEYISGLFLIDLDNFKVANDVLGHSMGDKILQDTASFIKQAVRNSDLLGRLGGDEIILLIKNATSVEVIEKIAEKLNIVLRNTYSKENNSVKISASIGIVILKGNMSFKEAYESADSALYYIKKHGRNSYFVNL